MSDGWSFERELGELRADVNHLGDCQIRIEKRLDELHKDTVEVLKSHAVRISNLERWRAYIAGAIAMMSMAATLVWGVVRGWFRPGG